MRNTYFVVNVAGSFASLLQKTNLGRNVLISAKNAGQPITYKTPITNIRTVVTPGTTILRGQDVLKTLPAPNKTTNPSFGFDFPKFTLPDLPGLPGLSLKPSGSVPTPDVTALGIGGDIGISDKMPTDYGALIGQGMGLISDLAKKSKGLRPKKGEPGYHAHRHGASYWRNKYEAMYWKSKYEQARYGHGRFK